MNTLTPNSRAQHEPWTHEQAAAEARAIRAAVQQARIEGYTPGSDAFERRVLQLAEAA